MGREEFLRIKIGISTLEKKMFTQSVYVSSENSRICCQKHQSAVPSSLPSILGDFEKKNFWLEFIADEKLQNTTHFYPGDTISKNTNYIVCVHFSHSLAGNIII